MADRASAWAGLAAATVVDNVRAARVLDLGIRHLAGPPRAAGPAFTVRPGRGGYSAVGEALDAAPPGSVLVVAGEAELGRAIWGEVSSTRAAGRRLAGAVIDGAIRDLPALRDGTFPVFAIGTTPRGPDREASGAIDVAVRWGGVEVRSGDLVLADLDGIVVVPAAAIDDGLEQALAGERRERARLREVADAPPGRLREDREGGASEPSRSPSSAAPRVRLSASAP